ncbi:MAG: hypothetical protein ACFFF4_00760 [Candidatus Thorarchaeota archaeon]
MSSVDSLTYDEMLRAYRNNIRWLGLSDSERNVMALLLTEQQWSGDPLSPEDISNVTGLARSSISAITSKLVGLGLIESVIDYTSDTRGRRKTLYSVTRGLAGLVMFGIRRIVVQLQDIVSELKVATHSASDVPDSLKIVEKSMNEAVHFLKFLTKCSDQLIADTSQYDTA